LSAPEQREPGKVPSIYSVALAAGLGSAAKQIAFGHPGVEGAREFSQIFLSGRS